MSTDNAAVLQGSQSSGVSGDWGGWCKEKALQTASYLTDPVCMARSFWLRSYVVKDLYPDSYRVTNLFREYLLLAQAGACALVAIGSTLPAMVVRYAVCSFQKDTFIYRKGTTETVFKGQVFTLFSRNICYTEGGYEISDGGVLSSPERIEALSREVLDKDADVVCLYEVFSVNDALFFYKKMKDRYAHFFMAIGPRVVGPSSGMFVASKFAVEDPQFLAFPKEMLDGRAKNAEKGIFSFGIKKARIFTTHFGHSEICANPTPDEKLARKAQMALMMSLVEKNDSGPKAGIVVGDLNLHDGSDEYLKADWKDKLNRGEIISNGRSTWGGDGYGAKLMNKEASGPLNLDYCMFLQGTAESITTELMPTVFNGEVFNKEALSDHCGLLSKITL